MFPWGFPLPNKDNPMTQCVTHIEEEQRRVDTNRGYVERCKQRGGIRQMAPSSTRKKQIPVTKRTGNFSNVSLI